MSRFKNFCNGKEWSYKFSFDIVCTKQSSILKVNIYRIFLSIWLLRIFNDRTLFIVKCTNCKDKFINALKMVLDLTFFFNIYK